MGTTRVAISIEDIDLQIVALRADADGKESEARELELEAQGLRAKASKLEGLKKLALEIGTPVPSGRAKVNRRDQLVEFLIKNGPHTRKIITEKTGIPEGTLNFEMRDRDTFEEVPDNRWDVTDAVKLQYKSEANPPTEEDLTF